MVWVVVGGVVAEEDSWSSCACVLVCFCCKIGVGVASESGLCVHGVPKSSM